MSAPRDETAETSDRIRRLLEELESTSGPATWRRVEELVQRLTQLYGAGLQALILRGEVTRAQLRAASEDEALSGILLLHGLHPLPTLERVQRALDTARPYLGSHAGDVQLDRIDADGVAHLKLLGTCRECPSSRATVEGMLRLALEDAAPELNGIEVDGIAPASAHAGGAVSTGARWTDLDGLSPPRAGERCAIEVEGVQVLLLGGAKNVLAYKNACPACGARLDGAALADPLLSCVGCGRSFDVAHAGRAVDPAGPHLQPFPVLQQRGAVRISLPEARR